jgi:hypothetical protein
MTARRDGEFTDYVSARLPSLRRLADRDGLLDPVVRAEP